MVTFVTLNKFSYMDGREELGGNIKIEPWLEEVKYEVLR